MTAALLNVETTLLVIIDVQERLWRVMSEKEKLLDNLQRLVGGAQVLAIPIIITEQYPQGLGSTVPELKALLKGSNPIAKLSFSACGQPEFMKDLAALNRKQVLLAGIESHVCVYQTAVDLIGSGFTVSPVADCISSRTPENRTLGLQRMDTAGAQLSSVEMCLFELLRAAEGEKFKAISKIVR